MRPSPLHRVDRFRRILVALTCVAAAGHALADDLSPPSAAEFEDALPADGSLTGREIYDRFLDNRFQRSHQRLRVISRDPGGSEQTTEFTLSIEDLRRETESHGMRGRVLVEVTAPFDVRHTQYLMIDKDPGPDDEFVYQPGRNKGTISVKMKSVLVRDYGGQISKAGAMQITTPHIVLGVRGGILDTLVTGNLTKAVLRAGRMFCNVNGKTQVVTKPGFACVSDGSSVKLEIASSADFDILDSMDKVAASGVPGQPESRRHWPEPHRCQRGDSL